LIIGFLLGDYGPGYWSTGVTAKQRGAADSGLWHDAGVA